MAATILLVEDDLLVRMGMVLMLKARGYEVSPCETGEAAVELVASAAPSLVLMDVKLAGAIDGIEAARRIMASYDVPVIFVTAQGDPLTRQGMLAVRPRGILSKPFTPQQLADAIEGALSAGDAAANPRSDHPPHAPTR